MSLNNITTPKVFISYSWTTKKHEEFVLDLAKRLTTDGVSVYLDKWDIKDGQSIHSYMEISISQSDKVLIICDKAYTEKADSRTGGVGAETLIITPTVYEDAQQEKFIPVIVECNEIGKPCIPIYIAGRKYIDLSDITRYEEGYENLLRNLFNTPTETRPVLGTPPKYLFEASPVIIKTTQIIKQIKNAYHQNPRIIKGLQKQFVGEFLSQLESFRIKTTTENKNTFDEEVLKSIHDMLPLRDDFISLLEMDCQFSENSFDIELYMDLFTEILSYTDYKVSLGMQSFYDWDFDNYKFLLLELFTYYISILLKHKKYSLILNSLNKTIWVKIHGELCPTTYNIFSNFDYSSLETLRNSRLELNLNSVFADTLLKRLLSNYQKIDLITADLLLFYISIINDSYWYPRLTFYLEWGQKLDFLIKLQSIEHFNNIKELFGVTSIDELRILMQKTDEKIQKISYYNIPYQRIRFSYNIAYEKIGTVQ